MPSIDPEKWRGCERWGKLRASTAALIAQALELSQSADKEAKKGVSLGQFTALLPYMVANMTTGDKLGYEEALKLREWLDAAGMPDVELEDVQVIQPNWPELLEILRHKQAATRAMAAWQAAGILTRAVSGTRGHSSVYIVEPLVPP